MILRSATYEDIEQIRVIYSDAVLNGVASFEEIPPDGEELKARMQAILEQGLPYIVAELDNKVLGYIYGTPFRPRSAYRFTLEDSIYLAPQARGKGMGTALLNRFIIESQKLGYKSIMASIGGGSEASVALHKSCGFDHVGTVKKCGFKFQQWQDLVYMQRIL